MTAVKKVMAMRQLDSMFGNMNLEGEGRHSPLVSSTIEHDPRCEVHGRCSTPYRSSLYLHSRESTPGYYRDSVSPTNGLIIRYFKYLILAVSIFFVGICLTINVMEQAPRFVGAGGFSSA